MRKLILAIGLMILGATVPAQQRGAKVASQPIPGTDAQALVPVVAQLSGIDSQIAALQNQRKPIQSQFNVLAQAALANAKLDSCHWAVSHDGKTFVPQNNLFDPNCR